MSPEESRTFFQQLLHGLLHNLQPLQGPGETQLHSSPLREASKDTLAAACQMLGPQAFLHQVLQSVIGLGTPSSSVDPKQLEVSGNHVSHIATCAQLSACFVASSTAKKYVVFVACYLLLESRELQHEVVLLLLTKYVQLEGHIPGKLKSLCTYCVRTAYVVFCVSCLCVFHDLCVP